MIAVVRLHGGILCAILFTSIVKTVLCDEVIFRDDFQEKLSSKFQVIGLKPEDYRIRNGGLEMRVQPGKWRREMPRIDVVLPFTDQETRVVSVKVTLLDKFTQEGELAGVHFFDTDGTIFKGSKERRGERLVYTPGAVKFVGMEGEEGDPAKYATTLVDETPDAGPLRIIVDKSYAFFQIGPSTKGAYGNHFFSAIRNKPDSRGFGLFACGAPEGSNHWVRFENFQVVER